jgi:hypothetical protein
MALGDSYGHADHLMPTNQDVMKVPHCRVPSCFALSLRKWLNVYDPTTPRLFKGCGAASIGLI